MDENLDWEQLPRAEFAFPGPLRETLVEAILAGRKTTTTSLLAECEQEGDYIPTAGERDVLIDSREQPVAVLENTEVRIVRLGDVDLRHVIDEGEGDKSIASWRAKHEAFWKTPEMQAELNDPNFTIDDDTMLVLERFRIIARLNPDE
ncbi:hypothetical protein KIM372_06020 [Bombiscardovia nodaiensis]|uniref:ASCH domain-containing protein n=1 Tax=Bombiscardovia nodaiensis TaxID=2932181 RepID=A0ABM8B759_9BIFI|nr:hypothetical protein KIM372_06020 [Bombiscardovia nodaiensis]